VLAALDAAHEAMTLLKNQDNTLPLSKAAKVLVAGPAAQSISALNGCWSYTWQGNQDQWYPADSKTIFQAISDKIGSGNVITTSVKGFDSSANYDGNKLKAAAADAQVIILCLGENAYAESPGNTRELALPKNQIDLAKAAMETGKPVILVLTEGRPRFITEIEPSMKGILMAYWSGKKSAEAIADVLFGDYNPNGRLPFSYPKSMGEIVLYDRKPTEEVREVFNDNVSHGYDPLFAFGHGLSYTSFQYSNLVISPEVQAARGDVTVSVDIKNTGSRKGDEVVQLYVRDLLSSVITYDSQLRGFERISLLPGEQKTVRFVLHPDDLALLDRNMNWTVEPGQFELMVASSSVDIKLKKIFQVK